MKPVPVSPRNVHMLVTSKCNLACRHCSIYGDGPIEGDLTLDQWRDIIRRLAEWKVFKLTISGGEPLVREDMPEIIAAILSHPLRFSLNTNAMLVTDEIARTLAGAAPRLESVMVSLDGAEPETHDAQRAPGAFDAMAEGVDRLRRAGVPVGFYCTVTRINVHELEAIALWGVERGGYVKFNDVLAVGRACLDSGLGLDQETRREAARRVAKLTEVHGPRITGTLLDMHRFAERVLAGEAKAHPQGSRGCGSMRGQTSIWPDGRMTPCDRIPHYVVGNVLESPLPELWRGKHAERFREMLAVPLDQVAECRECRFLRCCTGGCPVLPMREEGEILGRDPGNCVQAFLGEEVACARQR
jgi:SynChlorMet cassette radical SAM/SPASM protein ScmE